MMVSLFNLSLNCCVANVSCAPQKLLIQNRFFRHSPPPPEIWHCFSYLLVRKFLRRQSVSCTYRDGSFPNESVKDNVSFQGVVNDKLPDVGAVLVGVVRLERMYRTDPQIAS
jgi:hypothetical protein